MCSGGAPACAAVPGIEPTREHESCGLLGMIKHVSFGLGSHASRSACRLRRLSAFLRRSLSFASSHSRKIRRQLGPSAPRPGRLCMQFSTLLRDCLLLNSGNLRCCLLTLSSECLDFLTATSASLGEES